MRRMQGKNLWIAVVIVLLASACGSPEDAPGATDTPAASPTATADPEIPRLQNLYERLRESQAAIASIWETLAAGDQARCDTAITVIPPESISLHDTSPHASLWLGLREAAIAIDEASNLWQAECQQPRTVPPPDIVQAGVLAARRAGDRLDAVQTALQQLNGGS